MKNIIKKVTPQDIIYSATIFFIGTTMGFGVLLIQFHNSKQQAAGKQYLRANIKVYIPIIAHITLYHSVTSECGNNRNITSNGSKGKIGTCAATQKCYDYFLNYGDTVIVLEGSLKGKYVANDKAAVGDILVIDVWQPTNSKKHDCYKSIIIIKKGK